MNDPHSSEAGAADPGAAETMSALFANMVLQHTNMALMFLGRVPHPETGEVFRDVESARMFIDQLEMLEIKTKGNLDARETRLLRESLTTLRMVFVEAVDARGDSQPGGTPPRGATAASAPLSPAQPAAASDSASPSGGSEEESRKKFSKKY